jgi:hypothetical protein
MKDRAKENFKLSPPSSSETGERGREEKEIPKIEI